MISALLLPQLMKRLIISMLTNEGVRETISVENGLCAVPSVERNAAERRGGRSLQIHRNFEFPDGLN